MSETSRPLLSRLLAVAFGFFLTGERSSLCAADSTRPNILFCFADDWGRYAGAYAAVDGPGSPNDLVKTPNFDRVARAGVLFRHAFVPAPSCTPCRSSLLSGQYFFRTGQGAILQGAHWDPHIPSFPLMLQDSGYHIGETYKVWSPGQPNDAPYGGGKFAYEKAGGAFNDFSENVTAAVAKGEPMEAAKERLWAQVEANFNAFLAQRPSKAPFCYWFGPTNVHRKWQKGSGQALWGLNPEALKGKLPPFLPDVPEVREDLADYLGEIQAFDTAVGRLIKRLEAAGELDNTVIVLSGDHGPPGFPGGKCNLYDFGTRVSLAVSGPGIKSGRVVDDLVSLTDLAPTFLQLGGLPVPPVMTGRSLLDLLKSDKSGMVDPTRDFVITGRERHVAAAREENLPYPQRALRTRDFLYVRNFKPDRWPLGGPGQVTDSATPAAEELTNSTYVAFADMDASPSKAWLIEHRHETTWRWHYDYAFAKRPGEELYDLRKDPHQTKNVAADPAFAQVKAELAQRLLKQLQDAEDPRVIGDGLTFERPPFSAPVAAPVRAKKKVQGSK